jgi:hypothetical protein
LRLTTTDDLDQYEMWWAVTDAEKEVYVPLSGDQSDNSDGGEDEYQDGDGRETESEGNDGGEAELQRANPKA